MVSGVMLPMDELVITTGAMEALNLCLQVVTEPVTWWRSSRRRSTPHCGCWNGSSSKRWRFPSTRAKASIWRFSPIAWRTADQGLLVHEQPAESAGREHRQAKKRQLYDLLQRHQVPLIEDDVYAELYFTRESRPSR